MRTVTRQEKQYDNRTERTVAKLVLGHLGRRTFGNADTQEPDIQTPDSPIVVIEIPAASPTILTKQAGVRFIFRICHSHRMNQQDAKDLISGILKESPIVRYVAIYQDGLLVSQQREAVIGASHSESDRYEELLVNPTLLKLAKQRGDIDCGGLRFLIVRYDNFYQLIKGVRSRPHLRMR